MTTTKFAAALALMAASATTTNAYSFMAIGDWGASYDGNNGVDCSGNLEPQQAADGVAMGRFAADHEIDEVFLLGDNFYGSGIHGSCYNCRFQKTFEDIYNASSLTEIPFYAVAGNHDHLGNVSAQIEYSSVSFRWKFPDYYYSVTNNISTPSGKTITAQIVMIDTVLLDTLDGKFGENSDAPGAEVPKGLPSAESQWEWIEAQLSASTADYLWVGGHFPVWSGCEHGPTDLLVLKLKPMLEKYKVTGYMSGHDHCQEWVDEGKGPVYLITGSGFECCYSNANAHKLPENSVKFAYWKGDCPSGAVCPPQSKNSAFTVFNVTDAGMIISIIDSAGTVLYSPPIIEPRSKEYIDSVKRRSSVEA